MTFTIGLLSIFGSLHMPAWAGFQWHYLATARSKARVAFAIMFIISGISHFTKTEQFMAMIPSFLPNPVVLVYISGVFEILGAIGLLIPVKWVQRTAVYGTILLLLAIFPANIYAAINGIVSPGAFASPLYLWLRLPFQAFFIGWVWWAAGGKNEPPGGFRNC